MQLFRRVRRQRKMEPAGRVTRLSVELLEDRTRPRLGAAYGFNARAGTTTAAGPGAGRPPAGYIHSGSDVAAAGTSVLPLNTFSHVAVTYDGATIRLYVNGTQVGSQAKTGSIISSTGPLRIGGDAVWGEYFTGLID